MKFFAYYLPQFHRIPENDEWWGKGFTEWTNVKKAKPLYKKHIQPKHPMNNNYYSLDNVDILKWQQKLMNEYCVDGLIFYHYYFTGKKLLEKPAEMLLKNKDVNINFFFCWANHSWIRSWEGNKKVLVEQKYGTEKEWEEHFNYLLPFFKDDRYQKRDNKPLFVIFKSNFQEKNDMIEYFDKKCIENGFDGICVIETITTYNQKNIDDANNKKSKSTDFIHLREPDSSFNIYYKKINIRLFNKIKSLLHIVKVYDGNKIFKTMIENKVNSDKIIRGAFFEWDNTPRHSERGYIIAPPKKELFMKYLDSIKDNEYLFINAWNEWAEGMMLEPTEENKYKYLEWFKEWKEKNNLK